MNTTSNSNENEITSQVQTNIRNSFENHYHLSNQLHNRIENARCTGLTEDVYTYLLDVRDREWQHVRHVKQFEDVKKHLFSVFTSSSL